MGFSLLSWFPFVPANSRFWPVMGGIVNPVDIGLHNNAASFGGNVIQIDASSDSADICIFMSMTYNFLFLHAQSVAHCFKAGSVICRREPVNWLNKYRLLRLPEVYPTPLKWAGSSSRTTQIFPSAVPWLLHLQSWQLPQAIEHPLRAE